jgi:hypothetical protein
MRPVSFGELVEMMGSADVEPVTAAADRREFA